MQSRHGLVDATRSEGAAKKQRWDGKDLSVPRVASQESLRTAITPPQYSQSSVASTRMPNAQMMWRAGTGELDMVSRYGS